MRQILCRQLLNLTLDNNPITEVELKEHDNIRKISMKKNLLTSLRGFNALSELRELDLAENQITTLLGITGCPKLETLNLSKNKIEKLEGVPNLPSL